MQTIVQGYKNVSVLVDINLGTVLTTATVIGSLYLSAYLILG